MHAEDAIDEAGDEAGDAVGGGTGGRAAEIACVATHPDYRGEGRADALLALLEQRALRGPARRGRCS